MAGIPLKIKEKMGKFLEDENIQARFEKALEKADLREIIRPHLKPDSCGAEFRVKASSYDGPYPLMDHDSRIDCIEKKLKQLSRKDATRKPHPALVFYELTLYQWEFKNAPASGAKKKTQKKKLSGAELRRLELEQANRRRVNKLRKIKSSLSVSPAMKQARDREALEEALMEEFSALTSQISRQKKNLDASKSELEMYRNPDFMHPEIKKAMDDMAAEHAQDKIELHREKMRADSLEKQVNQLAEQIISTPRISEEVYNEEAEELRREYSVLSQKYDALVSKNIELANRLEKVDKAKGLEKILDHIRDNINGVLRAGKSKSDSVLLKNLTSEISELQRARLYLGRALYDVGLLYLRTGRKQEAIAELRAARELGIEDPETNKLLNY